MSFFLLIFSLLGFAGEKPDRIIGAVIVGEIFSGLVEVGSEEPPPPPTGKTVVAREQPSDTARAVDLKGKSLLAVMLHNSQGAAVFAKSGSWYQVAVTGESKKAWIKRKPEQFSSVEKLLRMVAAPELSFTEHWDGTFYAQAAGAKVATLPPERRPLLALTEVQETKWIGDQLWVKGSLILKAEAGKVPPKEHAWIPLFAPHGEWVLERNTFW